MGENPEGMDLIRRGFVGAAALALVVVWAAPALAAPQRLSAEPEPGAELHEPPAEVRLTFSEPLDESSEIRVFDECKRRLDDGSTVVELNEMSVDLKLGPTGVYRVVYLAAGLSGSTQEAYQFTVLHGGKSCDGSSGGHGGHDGDGDGNGGGGGDGGHGGHGGSGSGSGDDHDGHGSGSGPGDHDGMDHDSTDNDSMEHGTMKRHGGDHKAGHDRHGKKHGKHGKHRAGDDPARGDRGLPAQAAGDPFAEPSATALFGALGFAMLFGLLGGWVLRVAGPS